MPKSGNFSPAFLGSLTPATTYEKIRDNHRIASKAVMVIKAVNLEGQQEILAVEPMENESEETYSALFRRLQERGLEKVWLRCTSGASGCDTKHLTWNYMAEMQSSFHAEYSCICSAER